MHTTKFKLMTQERVLKEASREIYKKHDSETKSLIDPERSHLNFNVCKHKYSHAETIAKYYEIGGRKPREDAVFGSTIVTLPKDYDGDIREFFKAAYESLLKTYRISAADVIQAFVHMDETTPHMHFQFIPHKYPTKDGEKDQIRWDAVMTRAMYRKQHKQVQETMEKEYGIKANLINGKTLGIDVQSLTKDQKKEMMALKKQIEAFKREKSEIEQAYTKTKEAYETMVKMINENFPMEEIKKAVENYERSQYQPSVEERPVNEDLDWTM